MSCKEVWVEHTWYKVAFKLKLPFLALVHRAINTAMSCYLLNFSNGATRIFCKLVLAHRRVDTDMSCILWSLFPSKSQYLLDDWVPLFSPISSLFLTNCPNGRLGSRRACESSQSHLKGSHRVLEDNNSVGTSHLGGTDGLHHRKSRRFPVQLSIQEA